MTHYHAVMLDETGCEFGVGVEADSYEEARELLNEDYPESRVIQLESPADTAHRERLMNERIQREMDGDLYADEDY